MNISLSKSISQLQDRILTPYRETADFPLYLDALLDTFLAVYDDYSTIEISNSANIQAFLKESAATVTQLRSLRPSRTEYDLLKPLAQGEFGMVSIVREKSTGAIYAMKTIHKQYILKRKEQAFYMEERDILALGRQSKWIPKLHTAFQDHENLYLIMEYIPGGDLFSLLANRDEPILDEQAAKFYIAEIILAVTDLHNLGYVHRDIKPSNILIDETGHIKLADFGSCIKLGPSNKVTSSIPVGTCDYISPEVLQAQEANYDGYGRECDWWSVGVVLYELLQGDPPFYSESIAETYSKIMRHEEELQFLDDIPLSTVAQDLIRKLLCAKENRLGRNGVEEIKKHAFFDGYDWDDTLSKTPPYIPTLESACDTSNFLSSDDIPKPITVGDSDRNSVGKHLPFIGFTFHLGVSKRLASNPREETYPTEVLETINGGVLKEVNIKLKHIIDMGKLSHLRPPDEDTRPKTQLVNSENMFTMQAIPKQGTLEVKSLVLVPPRIMNDHLENEIAVMYSSLEQISCQVNELHLERKHLLSSKKDLEAQVEMLTAERNILKTGLDEARESIVEMEDLRLSLESEKHRVSQLQLKNQILENNLRKYKDLRYSSMQSKFEQQAKLELLINEKIDRYKPIISRQSLIQTQVSDIKLEETFESIYGEQKETLKYNQPFTECFEEIDQTFLENTIKFLMKNNQKLSKQLYHCFVEREMPKCETNNLQQELSILKKDKISTKQPFDSRKCTKEEIFKKITGSTPEGNRVSLERKMSQLVEEDAYIRKKLTQAQKELQQRAFQLIDLEKCLLDVQRDKEAPLEKWIIKPPGSSPTVDKDYRRYSTPEKLSSLQEAR